MAITFSVSEVERATNLLLMPADGAGGNRVRKLHGQPVEACGSSTWPFIPAEQHGLLRAVHMAYALHYPLVLTPDAVWLCIAQGFAMHVNANAERLRGKFVRHEGKLEIKIRRDDFVKGSPNNPWPEVFGAFSDAIAEHIGRQRDLVVCDFSTTGPCERAASEIVLMNAVQRYFDYNITTVCGIPEITLEGTPEDWKSIRRRARALEEYELSWWTQSLGPVLDELVAASGGEVNIPFWEALYKEVDGSGGPYVSGWINVLFPYIKTDDDSFVRNKVAEVSAWGTGKYRRGAKIVEAYIPSGISSVPYKWDYLGDIYPMLLLGGFVGVAQDEGSLALRPAIGWAVRDAVEDTTA